MKAVTMGQKMLLWLKSKLKDEIYKGVDLSNLTESFRDGVTLLAVIHRFTPNLVDFSAVNKVCSNIFFFF